MTDTNQLPALPTPKFTGTRRGVPCITVTEHEHLMRAYALQALAQVRGEAATVAVDHFDNAPHTDLTNRIHPPVEIGTKLYTTPQPAQATQAEAQQPATGEPVVVVVVVQHRKPVIGWKGETIGYTGWRDGKGLDGWPHRELYDHPAPSVPNLIEKAISSGCFGVLPVKATIPMCKAGWGASGGELTFQQIGHIYEEMYKARPLPDEAIDAAMLTAAQAKKEKP